MKKSTYNSSEHKGEQPIRVLAFNIIKWFEQTYPDFISELESEVDSICGDRYKHGKANHRWGAQKGSIILGNQNIALEIPYIIESPDIHGSKNLC